MKFKFRLAYYMFGLLLGAIFVVYFLGSKAESRDDEFCYLPNCRALKDLRSKPISYSEEAQVVLNENWISLDDIKLSMKHGDIDFSKSNEPYKNGKIYLIEGKTTQNEEIIITMINYTDRVVLEDIKKK